MTGFSPKTRETIVTRAKGTCERCCRFAFSLEIHHRRPRGMGGSKDWLTNSPANGVLLCTDCHRFIESHRDKARALGWLVRQGQDPQSIPVYYLGSTWVRLTIDGEVIHDPPSDSDPESASSVHGGG